MKRFTHVALGMLLPFAVLASAGGMAWYIIQSAPEVARTSEPAPAPVVEVVPPGRGPFARHVEAYGTVRPAKEVTISPEVSGRVLEIHPALEPGGIIPEGALLLRIAPEEYELSLKAAEGALAEAQAALEVEQGRQRVAQREWELFGKDLPEAEMGRQLALREPQLRQAEARIESALSEVERARLDLERTRIYAPFDALVLDESVDAGQLVREGASVATLAGTNAFWVLASVPADRLAAVLEAARTDEKTVRVYSDVESAAGQGPRLGVLVRHLGQVDPEGRMAQVLVEVTDPLHLEDDARSFPLPLNSYVRVELDAGTLKEVAAIPRRAMRENNEVWVSDRDRRLAIRPVEVVWRQGENLAVSDVFEPGDQLIVSPLADALPGMALRTRAQEPAAQPAGVDG